MSLETWWTFFFAAWAIALSPGSGAVLSMSHGLSYGMARASITILGLQAGLMAVLLVAGAGLGALLIASETAFSVVKVVGALYLIWIGLQQWRSPAASQGGQAVAPMPARRRFLSGVLTNATNPKGIVFMVAVLPQFIDPSRPLGLQLLILGATMSAVDLTVMHGYALLAARMQRWFRSERAGRWQNRFFGGVLMAVGAALFFVRRTPH
ncbi:LysE family transporter [Aquabacterium sp. A7-Y]|uniref:LysE family transporter n=1 Tax=Aquabacterium sp. A7-Y TaxID=1349605 RepID=UPI00223DDAD4|nr:LysE family transporter [Aquabacterium sp. A7-Y]MCW7537574.1 LysE family transporter [Aquabacterium sp. A7-Y]